MMIALAAENTGFGGFVGGYWYPGNSGQIFLLFAATIFFTFLGSYWFGLAFKARSMASWMMGAFKACIVWLFYIVAAILIPVGLFAWGVQNLQNKVVNSMTITPFIAESISGALTFGLTIVVTVLVVAFFYTNTRGARWFLEP